MTVELKPDEMDDALEINMDSLDYDPNPELELDEEVNSAND